MKQLFYILILIGINTSVFSQKIHSMDELIRYAQEYSTEALKIKTLKENKYWQWKNHKANYRPQLVLNATLPSYQKQNIAVRQEDGSIAYRSINQSQISGMLSLEQNIGITGGKLFLSSDLSRFDDYENKYKSFNGSPIYIGIEQPIFAFNELKWMNKIEPEKYSESQKEYIEKKENIALNTVTLYFDLLLSQINLRSALKNKENADTIYKIGVEKYNIGRISKNELLQLNYGLISAQKSIASARFIEANAILELNTFTGLIDTEKLTLSVPIEIISLSIDRAQAVNMAMNQSKQAWNMKIRLLEAQRDADRAKKESRLNARLSLSFGKTNLASNINDVYENPKNLQTIEAGIRIPILDWGRAKSGRKIAEANLKLAQYSLQQEEMNMKQQITSEIENFQMFQDFISYAAEADKIANERYEIAKLRYVAGNISLTEYNIALEEKDKAKQDYIIALKDYWLSYFTIRILTLYDFKNNVQLSINE